MATQYKTQTVLLDTDYEPDDLLKIPIIKKLISDLMPTLLDKNDGNEASLRMIAHYLFHQKYLQVSELESHLDENLCTALYGLKSLLKNSSMISVSLALETGKIFFMDSIRQYEEEE